MAEISSFFNSAPGDPRTYQASDFASYFGDVLSSGLLHTDNIPALEVKVDGTNLQTYVEPGKAIIEGYGYQNTSDLYLTHALPEATLDRIDRIVLRLDKRNQSRFIKLFVLQGTASATPVAPALTRDEFVHELSLAQIRVRANTSTLDPQDLIDERLDEDLCGLVYSLISIPTSQFQAEWDAFMEDIQAEGFASASEFAAHKADETIHITDTERTTWNGKQDASLDLAKFKKSSSTYTDNDTSQTFTDAFCTANSLVTVVITSATPPKGVWSVNSSAGSFTITSTLAEDNDITFDYYIQKAVG